MNLSKLCLAHASITFAAGVVLVAAPALIPSTVGIHLNPNEYLLAYLLAGTELGLAALSYNGRNLRHPEVRRVVVMPCIVVHASSAALEVLAFAHGVSSVILVNAFVRIIVVGLFAYYGFFAHNTKFSASNS
ncbi:hypothetical protein ACFONN_16260 [Dyella humi]|uniref:Integral membrane protein n=1 Tax=Dyella humi TaxID=1770547 RepID=A0ABW8IP70_9GAMM